MNPVLQEGDCLVVPPKAYRPGRDWLRLRVTRVLTPAGREIDSLTWVQVTGREISGGVEGRERTVVVRVAALESWPPIRRSEP
ncbi:hypothetical protein AB0J86_32095 [Micromonospora sp. NPDC049559]|uniref:hypothetical protein n=1 Tax=Micromonospora sp. NPDC049559 TaxID=3155923 RepID=UPI00342639F5